MLVTKNALEKSTTIALVPQSDLQQMIALDSLSKRASAQLLEYASNEAVKALVLARAIREFQSALNDNVMQDIMQLQNTILGFRTDRENGYGREVVRDVVAQAFIKGLRVTGNEINIIAGNLYVTVEGYARLIRDVPGLTNLTESIGVPMMAGDKGALVPARAAWKINGRADSLEFLLVDGQDFRLPIKVNNHMGVDAIRGKARSKLLRAVYRQVTGSVLDIDPDEPDPADSPALAATKKMES